MITRNTTRFNCVEGRDGADFMAKLNAAFAEYDAKGIKYTYQADISKGFIAYIFYEQSVDIPETIKEEFERADEKHTCIECPYFNRPFDGRRKWVRCDANKCICRADGACCDRFYNELLNGVIELVDPYYEVERHAKAEAKP